MDLNKFPIVTNDISAIFGMESGWDDADSMERAFKRNVIDNSARLPLFKIELLELFSDLEVDWLYLLVNEEYEVWLDEKTQESAKKFVVSNLWRKVFPDQQAP